jgi:DNA-binding MarR family transcriptional regulator
MKQDENQLNGISKLQEALKVLRTNIRGKDSRTELPTQMLLTFLKIASSNGITMKEAAKEMDVEQSTVSRNAKDMGTYLIKEEDGSTTQMGCGLVYNAPNELNRREFSVFLTAKGQRLIHEIDKILS